MSQKCFFSNHFHKNLFYYFNTKIEKSEIKSHSNSNGKGTIRLINVICKGIDNGERNYNVDGKRTVIVDLMSYRGDLM